MASQDNLENGKHNVCDTSSTCQLQQIQTFVFIDLESTGFNGVVNSHITELSMVVVSRDDLEGMQTETAKDVYLVRTPRERILKSNQKPVPPTPKKRSSTDAFQGDSDAEARRNKVRRPLFQTPQKDNVTSLTCDNHKADSAVAIPEKEEFNGSKSTQVDSSDEDNINSPYFIPKFHTSPKLPRVLHKLTRVFNPRAAIFPSAEDVTGLNNDIIAHVSQLDKDFCILFEKFLQFPKPVCLVAHNGKGFDFPLIVAEFLNVTDCQFNFSDIFCVDSLEIIKVLDKLFVSEEFIRCKTLEHKNGINMSDNNCAPSTSSAKDESDQYDLECVSLSNDSPTKVKLNENKNLLGPRKSSNNINNTSGLPRPGISSTDAKTPKLQSDSSSSDNLDDSSSSMIQDSYSTPKTNSSLPNIFSTPKSPCIEFPPTADLKERVELCLKDSSYNFGLSKANRPFSQPNIYARLFGSEYEAHRAEEDCEALLQICGHFGEKFTQVADILMRPLSDINPMWVTTSMIKSTNFKQNWRK